mgnify:CR=1 FL=1
MPALNIKKKEWDGVIGKSRNDFILNKSTVFHPSKLVNSVIGFLFFMVFIVIIIPLILLKYKKYSILAGYAPNVDLIANVLTWWRGPFDLFKDLYRQIPTSLFSLFTQTFINYLALLGLAYIVIKKSVKKNNIYEGWGAAFVMFIVTYLVPSRMVSEIMNRLARLIKNDGLVSMIGMVFTLLIILFENVILEKYGKSLAKYSKLFIDSVKKMV